MKPQNTPLSEEERLLLARSAELAARAEHTALSSPFLTPRQQRLLFESAQAHRRQERLFFWGGYPGASRRLAIFLPEWVTAMGDLPPQIRAHDLLFSEERETAFLSLLTDAGLETPPTNAPDVPAPVEAPEETGLLSEHVCPLLLSGSTFHSLSHRDWLGALMALGIKRELLGDIAVEGDSRAVVFCQPKGAQYLIAELSRAGRDAVHASFCRLPAGFAPKQEYEEVRTTVASPRLDGVVRALCNISREDAAALIERGYVEQNYDAALRTDGGVAPGDVLSVRGYGKFRIDSVEEPTRRGRLHLAAKKYK